MLGTVTEARDYEDLHRKWAPRMLEAIFELRGFFLKGGQLMASNYANATPPIWQKALEPCLDQQPRLPFDTIRAIVDGDLGRPLEEVFSSFETEPIAAASIGQVHRAVLKDGSVPVVVKVMYPDVEGQFRGDVAITRAFYQFALPEQVDMLDEVEKQFVNEFDYRREAKQLDTVRQNLARAGLFGHMVVPRPFLDPCTKHVLVMTEVVGAIKLTTALEQDLASLAVSKAESVELLQAQETAANEEALARGQLRTGPDSASMDKVIASIRQRNRWGRLLGSKPLHVPLNHAALVDDLLAVHGHEVLVDGYFNGDPHPGNLLVVRGADGDFKDLALIDDGQVKVLSQHARLQLARLMLALAKADDNNAAHRKRVAELIWDKGSFPRLSVTLTWRTAWPKCPSTGTIPSPLEARMHKRCWRNSGPRTRPRPWARISCW